MPKNHTELIVALDVDSKKEAQRLVDDLCKKVKIFKVGKVYFDHQGHDMVRYINKKGCYVFLDMKWYDIPNTVRNFVISTTASAVAISSPFNLSNILSRIRGDYSKLTKRGIFMMTVHAQGSPEMLEAAALGADEKSKELGIEKPRILGITVLTNENGDEATVLKMAKKAQNAGLDGVVCSAHEAKAIREQCGDDFLIIVPGIRPKSSPPDDQKRKATVAEAVKAGADYIVVGRPIIKDQNPKKAAGDILEEIQEANKIQEVKDAR